MVKTPSIDKNGMKKGLWSEEEDYRLRTFIESYGHKNWRQLPKFAGLSRCGKSCRLRWMNYLRPELKKGNYSIEEDEIIVKLHKELGSKWSVIAKELPGRSDNDIKNHWHTHLKKRVKEKQKTKESTFEISNFDEFKLDDIIANLNDVLLPENSQTVSTPLLNSKDEYAPGGGMMSSSSSSSISTVSSGMALILDDNMNSLESFMVNPLESFWMEPFISDNFGDSMPVFEGENFPVQEGDVVLPYFEDAYWY